MLWCTARPSCGLQLWLCMPVLPPASRHPPLPVVLLCCPAAVRRSRLEEWVNEPFFEDTLPGCLVRWQHC